MKDFTREVQVRWADLDPNAHLRHSVYYDWGAFCRITFLSENNLSIELMQQLQIGPVLLREECIFRKEIRLGDKVTISLQILNTKKDFSRWTIQHTIMKNNESVAAVITVDGAWLNIGKRKLAIPPAEVADVFSQMPLAENFQWLD